MVLTTDSSAGAGQLRPLVVQPYLCSVLTARHIGAQEGGFWCSSFNVFLRAFASLAENLCCLESKIPGAGVSPASLISAPRGVVGTAAKLYLACQLKRSWRPS
jgi:hypothetical protein